MGIGFFAPLPLAMMIPFMAGQSLIMGESFGKGFQFGKRKISSMSNEQFNAMDAKQLGTELLTDYQQIIPSLEQAVRASSDFQQMVIQELIKIIPNFVDQLLSGGNAPGSEGGKTVGNIPGVASFISSAIPFGIPDKLEEAQTQAFPPPPPNTTQNNAYENWASRWINYDRSTANFSTATAKELKFMLDMISKGQGGKTTKWRLTIIKWWEKKTPKPKTAEEEFEGKIIVIDQKTVKGTIVQKIATLYAFMKLKMDQLRNRKRLFPKANHKGAEKTFLVIAKQYNQFVAQNRFPKLQIDTAKSLQQVKLVPKS